MMNIRILLADDHIIVREGVRHVLDNTEGMEVIDECEDGREAVRLAIEKTPDVILMDISMPELNGIEATQHILRDSPQTKIIILSMHSHRRFVERAIKAGVTGYLLKNSAVVEIVSAVKSVMQGKIFLSPGVTNVVVENFIQSTEKQEKTSIETLTLREREILQLIAEGLTTKEIADHLHISDKTVEGHRTHLMGKLHLRSIAQLTKLAIREGFTSLEE